MLQEKPAKSKFRYFCESLDLLGETPSLTLNKQSNFKTYFGGIITLVFYLLCLLSMIYYAIFIFSKDPVQVEYSSTYTFDFPTMDLWEGNFLIGLMVLQGNKFVPNDLVSANFNITMLYEKVSRTVDFETGKFTEDIKRYIHKSQPCLQNPKLDLYRQYIGPDLNGQRVMIDMANCFYPNPAEPESVNYFKVSSRPDSPPYEKLTVSVAPCNPAADSACKGALSPAQLAANYVYFILPVVGIDSSNPETPISYSSDASYRLEYLPGIVTSSVFSLKVTEVYNFHEEFIGGDTFVQQKYAIDTRRMGWTTGTALSPYFTLSFVSGNLKEVVVRTYFSPLNWFASIGGIMEILSLACAAIYYFYGEFFYGRFLLNEIYIKDLEDFKQSKLAPEANLQSKEELPVLETSSKQQQILESVSKKFNVKDKNLIKILKTKIAEKNDFVNFLKGITAMQNFQDRVLDEEQKLVLPLILAIEASFPSETEEPNLRDALYQLYGSESESAFHRDVDSQLKSLLESDHLNEKE